MDELQLHNVRVDFEGLMEVLGKNLYSTPEVAVRELVQNAHDSCVRRRIESSEAFDASVRIKTSIEHKTLVIEDTGAGLTRQEILDYLATIGAGYTRKLREQHKTSELIGAFGLGFLSAYIISEGVRVETTSFQQPDETWCFSSKTGERFSLEPAESRPVGTRVIIQLAEDFTHLNEGTRLHDILERYCPLLPIPIHLDGFWINEEPPPWLLDESEARSVSGLKKRLAFAERFERRFEPICTLEVVGQTTTGVMWIQDGWSYASADQRNVTVFVRGMMVSDDERELLPSWAGFVGAVISSDQLTPTASREDLMKDAAYQVVREELREALVEGLAALPDDNPAAWRRVLRRHNEALLGACVSDPRLFDALAHRLTLPTTEGDLRVDEILPRTQRKLYITVQERKGPEEVLHRALQKPIIDGFRYAAYPFAQEWAARQHLKLIQLGTKAGDEALFPPAEVTPSEKRRIEQAFGREGYDLVPTRFEPAFLPMVLVFDWEVELKRRVESEESDKRISTAVLGLARLYTQKVDDSTEARVFVNLASPVVQSVLASEEPERRGDAVDLVWAMAAMMAPRGSRASELEEILQRCASAIARLSGMTSEPSK